MNWLLHNARSRLLYALRNPRYAVGSLYRELAQADERFLAKLTGTDRKEIRRFLDEPIRSQEFAACLKEAEMDLHKLQIQSADLYAKKVLVQYATIRALRPENVVETGVANGVSSAYLLFALKKNARGKLYSIELGDPQYLPSGRPPGWVVPNWLKAQWQLIIGDARDLLPRLLGELGTVDIFIHDSLHTYEHMFWEFRAAYPSLRPGGLIISDDAAWNSAFPEFCREVHARDARILRGVGFLQKNCT